MTESDAPDATASAHANTSASSSKKKKKRKFTVEYSGVPPAPTMQPCFDGCYGYTPDALARNLCKSTEFILQHMVRPKVLNAIVKSGALHHVYLYVDPITSKSAFAFCLSVPATRIFADMCRTTDRRDFMDRLDQWEIIHRNGWPHLDLNKRWTGVVHLPHDENYKAPGILLSRSQARDLHLELPHATVQPTEGSKEAAVGLATYPAIKTEMLEKVEGEGLEGEGFPEQPLGLPLYVVSDKISDGSITPNQNGDVFPADVVAAQSCEPEILPPAPASCEPDIVTMDTAFLVDMLDNLPYNEKLEGPGITTVQLVMGTKVDPKHIRTKVRGPIISKYLKDLGLSPVEDLTRSRGRYNRNFKELVFALPAALFLLETYKGHRLNSPLVPLLRARVHYKHRVPWQIDTAPRSGIVAPDTAISRVDQQLMTIQATLRQELEAALHVFASKIFGLDERITELHAADSENALTPAQRNHIKLLIRDNCLARGADIQECGQILAAIKHKWFEPGTTADEAKWYTVAKKNYDAICAFVENFTDADKLPSHKMKRPGRPSASDVLDYTDLQPPEQQVRAEDGVKVYAPLSEEESAARQKALKNKIRTDKLNGLAHPH